MSEEEPRAWAGKRELAWTMFRGKELNIHILIFLFSFFPYIHSMIQAAFQQINNEACISLWAEGALHFKDQI